MTMAAMKPMMVRYLTMAIVLSSIVPMDCGTEAEGTEQFMSGAEDW